MYLIARLNLAINELSEKFWYGVIDKASMGEYGKELGEYKCYEIGNGIASLTKRLIRNEWQTIGINSFLDLTSQKKKNLLHQTNIIIDPI